MKRRYLFEIVDYIQEAEDKAQALLDSMRENKHFKMFVYMIYNPEFKWEAGKEILSAKSKSDRELGGYENAWTSIVLLMKKRLIRATRGSVKFVSGYIKLAHSCNYKDVEYMNHAIKYRCLKGIKKKEIKSALTEEFGEEYAS